MSDFKINNIARIIDVRPVIAGDATRASNDRGFSSEPVSEDVKKVSYALPYAGEGERAGVSEHTESLNALLAMLTSFFTKLLNLVSDHKEKFVPETVPTPPPVIPQVVPEPLPPTPDVATNIPGLSNKRNGARPDNIWSGFRQGPDGNCVTVSAIKAAMYRFGQSPTDIFKSVTKVNGGYKVVMRDDFQLSLTDRELSEGARGAQFFGPDKGMLKDAQFLFAVSAKRAQMENNDRTAGRSFQAAIRSLNDGEDERGPGEGFLRLGLKRHMKTVSVRDLARGQVGMCNRTGHSVAVINGREELWGRRGAVPTRGQAVALI
ncbi:hypothetical protein [Pseudomonas sp. MWU15-20650]|uniref:hypothetical protein n=1 Tax=Pseudomonas sp. MWU15-20650 TaxID=2933107 RepID=UPI00200FE858|nr:hypothetical protein [Pseudomonas sp. MWU15-20650]